MRRRKEEDEGERGGRGGGNEKRVQGKPNNSSTLFEVARGEADVDLQ